jgi:hypothetical protein
MRIPHNDSDDDLKEDKEILSGKGDNHTFNELSSLSISNVNMTFGNQNIPQQFTNTQFLSEIKEIRLLKVINRRTKRTSKTTEKEDQTSVELTEDEAKPQMAKGKLIMNHEVPYQRVKKKKGKKQYLVPMRISSRKPIIVKDVPKPNPTPP